MVILDRPDQYPEVIDNTLPEAVVKHPVEWSSNQYTTPEDAYEPAKDKKFLSSIRKTSIWWAIALLLVMIAAAVGGGVAGSRAVAQARRECSCPTSINGERVSSSPTSSAPTQETSAIFSVPRVATWGDATGTNMTITSLPIPASRDFTFQHSVPNSTVFDVTYNGYIPGSDVGFAVTSSFEECINTCVLTRVYDGGNPELPGCMAIQWVPSLTNQWNNVKKPGLNCFLKVNVASGTIQPIPDGPAWFAIVRTRDNVDAIRS